MGKREVPIWAKYRFSTFTARMLTVSNQNRNYCIEYLFSNLPIFQGTIGDYYPWHARKKIGSCQKILKMDNGKTENDQKEKTMSKKANILPAPLKTRGFVKVTNGIHVYIGGNGTTDFGLILTQEKPVIIDNDIRIRKDFLAGMRRITRKDAGLVLNTHHNFDHTSDNGYYTKLGAITFGVELAKQEMEREQKAGIWVKQMAGRGPRVEHLIGKLDISPPMVTFKDQIDIHYGGRHFQMIYIDHCHTKGDTVVWMPNERVLFSGDLLTYRTHPVNRLGNFINWIPALNLLKKKFPAKYIVPGHGPIPPQGTKIIDENKTYLTRLRTRTAAALRKEKSPTKAAKLVQMPEYSRWFRAQNVPNNALKMANDLRKKR